MRKNRQLSSLATASGAIARAAYIQAKEAGLDVGQFLKSAKLTVQQANDPSYRISVRSQIKLLNLVADALPDEFLGVHLAEALELRQLGLLYYVISSSENLSEAYGRVARYSRIHNEGVKIVYREHKDISVTFQYVGASRTADIHQIEFFAATLLRLSRQLSGRQLSPDTVRFMHRRAGPLPPKIRAFFGCDVTFGSDADEVVYPGHVKAIACVNADPYLNSLLLKYCEDALKSRRTRSDSWRFRVENTIASLLPHGQADALEIAKRLGVSQRTLARRLASEGLTFAEILDNLRFDLAKRYLQEDNLPISEVAWLLGYRQSGAFSHAFKRWADQAPRDLRSASRAVAN
jgi:AraC-like DNA-binding protein